MPGRRAIAAVLATFAVLAVLAAGCGDNGSPPTSTTAGPAADTEAGPGALAAGWATDFTRHRVPFDEISSGGPPKDGIPPIDRPEFVPVSEAGFLSARDPVLVVEVAGRRRGYPIQILIWHEIVNDTLSRVPIAVTYCPLCNTAIVFDRRLDGRVLDFGTTGNLRNSDLVMYDRQTQSWWQQFGGDAIVGELTGRKLTQLPAQMLPFDDVRRRFPDLEMLSRETGFDRPYGRNPYEGYDEAGSPQLFPSRNEDDRRLDPKARVVFVEQNGQSAAIPFAVLTRKRSITFTLGGRRLTARWRPGVASALDAARIAEGDDVGAAEVRDDDGVLVPFDEPLWFSVAAFRPDVRIVR